MLTKNQKLTLSVIDLNHLGYGVAKPDGFTVFVSGAVTGEEVEAVVLKVNRTYAVAKAVKILSPSPYRTDTRCHNTACHACAYRDIFYTEECKKKETSVRMAFRKAGLPEVEIAPLVPSPVTVGYRNKAQYPIAADGRGGYLIGFYAPKSHRVTEAADCPLAAPGFSGILETLRAFFVAHRLTVFDAASGRGLLRHIYLRRGEISGEVLLTLVVGETMFPHEEELVRLLRERHGEIVGILLNFNGEDTNVILGNTYRLLWGRDRIYDTLAGVRLGITVPSFYQVNHAAAELLYAKAKELAALTGRETLLDLYCGVGSIGLSMARDAAEVIGVEIVESATRCAEENAVANGIGNAHFYAGDAADTEGLLRAAEAARGTPIRPDVVLLDPPRGGCDIRTLDFVCSLNPSRIVYISCNPETLARDVAHLVSLGYEPGVVTPVDLFPGTGHTESVVRLLRGAKE